MHRIQAVLGHLLMQGSDLYVNWIAGAGQSHDVFFTDQRIIASYRELLGHPITRETCC